MSEMERTSGIGRARTTATTGPLTRASAMAAVWALGYALYRAYYGLGGRVGMIGELESETLWRQINLVAAAILLVAAALPLVALPLWRRRRARPALLAVTWLIVVGCFVHGVVDDTQRVLSLAGVATLSYPPGLWASIDRRAADVQDLVFNETWFLIEGLVWARIAWLVLGPTPARRRWFAGATLVVGGLVVVGLLSAYGYVGRLIIG